MGGGIKFKEMKYKLFYKKDYIFLSNDRLYFCMNIKKIKALIVDDDSRFCALLKKTLESKDCEVQTSGNDITALSYLINEHYHVVFIDCILRDKNGMEFSHKIREILGDSVQIIMMSGIVSSKSLSSYIDLGVLEFLAKPVSESEIDINLRNVKEKYLYGKQDNILIKLFKENISTVDSLKYLISLKQASGYEFFLYLSLALSTRESLNLEFTLNNKTHELILDKGNIVDCKYKNLNLFIERFVSNNLIQPEEAESIVNKSAEEAIKYLTSEFILSPDQIISFKYDFFVDTLKNIYPKDEISLNFEILPAKKESSIILTQNEYADFIFLCLKQKFNNEVFHLFDKNLMERHLIFNKKDIKTYLPEMELIIDELKSKIKFNSLYQEHIKDKNIFCFYILYILLKGGVFISDKEELDYNYFYERYKKLENFIKQTDFKKLFNIMSGLDAQYIIPLDQKKNIYNNFLKKNHRDFMEQYNLPEKVLNQVDQTTRVLKRVYEESINPNTKRLKLEQEKEERMKEEMLIAENKKLFERYLIEKNYKSAISILDNVSQEKIDKDLEWLLLLTWFYLKVEKDRKKEKELLNLMTVIQKNKKEFEQNKIYYYIVGLNYMNKENYFKALESFKICKKLDYSFNPVYEELKISALRSYKKKQKTNTFFSKLNNFKINKKKTG